jgi:hypothetical protein
MKKPRRQPRLIITYFGVNIYRNTEPGYRLRWSTIAPNLAADTLAGIRQLIRENK